MEPNSLKWVGSACGLHGSYIFYKAFKFHLEGRPRILSLGDFFFVRCKPEDPICIAELQLLWEERTTKELLSSSKLYFLPEDIPRGRTASHGEDEVIAVSEKVIVKLDNLVKWASSDFSNWKCGLQAMPLKPSIQKELGMNGLGEALQKYRQSTLNSGLNFKDVLKDKAELGEDQEEKKVLILSYPQYCRYRSVIVRLQERPSSLWTDQIVLALGGIAALNNNTQILYCRDTFDHPSLIENESICDEFAPNLKGRPRKKKPLSSQRRDSQISSGVKESNSNWDGKALAKVKTETKAVVAKPKNNSNCKKAPADEKPQVGAGEECRADEQAFLVALYKYMKERKTPIERIPYLGFKQINLWTMFQAAQKLGGYELITARRQWKNVYDELGGNPGSTSAATCTRRHYERLILPYERYVNGEEDKPLPPVKPRKPESGPQEGGSKAKLAVPKRMKSEQSQKPKKEKDISPKAMETSAGADVTEECPVVAEQKLAVQQQQNSMVQEEGVKEEEEEDGEEEEEEQEEEEAEEEEEEEEEDTLFTVKNEIIDNYTSKNAIKVESQPLVTLPSPSLVSAENGPLESTTSSTPLQTETDTLTNTKPEQQIHCLLDKLSNELQEKAASALPLTSPQLLSHSNLQDQRRSIPVNVDTSETPNHQDKSMHSLKQPARVHTTSQTLTEREEVASKDEACLSYSPVLYPKGNPGIMSPLAKKKMLSQVSSTNLPNNYSFGPPPPLVNKKALNVDESAGSQGSQVSNSEIVMINRPSVIQHAQSFKIQTPDERKPLREVFKHDLSGKQDSSVPIANHQFGSPGETYSLRPDIHDSKEKNTVKRAVHPSQVPSFLAEFYSSHHLHNLYRQTEHLNREQLSKYLGREMHFNRDYEKAGLKTGLSYSSPTNQKERISPDKMPLDDQPTDLSLPKPSAHKLPSSKPLASRICHSHMHQDNKTTSLFQINSSQASSLNCNPKACRVPPMTMSTNKKPTEPLHRAPGKPHNTQADNILSRKMEEIVRPILSTKSSTQNIGAARPLKRSLEDQGSGPPEKKIKAVTPMHLVKEPAGKAKTPDLADAEGSKSLESLHAVHASHLYDNHKYSLPTPIFPGLYPGAFVSQVQDMCNSLGSHIPAGYAHPLQYLKNQAVISPLMPPLAIHSIMMQRQLLASSAHPPQIYRHPVGASYGDFLHHMYPLTTLNPQSAFNPSQMSPVHPSTKL
ncbi:AT-rich interactive domain-containing protein 5B-like [Acipenser ruthenus]|uniref:AT-rich interactive domain-containing protein 5B-like n=1 Tax=Acipenser ruthenus TaxID=7906 RepID=UPI00145AEF47|nr:AT-rich interactive domain-containing protein 5B-like [Acipenser ruthenus]